MNETPNIIQTFLKDNNGNLHYDDYHVNYAVGGDTDSIMFSIEHLFEEGEDQEKVTEYADQIASQVNDGFPQFMEEVFNVPPERKDVIQTDREIISDYSFFGTKKRYAMHVVNDEGSIVDKWKIQGLEIKKSDTPKALKPFLEKLVKMLAYGKDLREINEAIQQFKEEYYTMSLQDIGRPMPTKVLGKYQTEYEMTGSMKGFPYHVRAFMFYNQLCGPDDQKINPGEEGIICYIHHKDSNYIGVPYDLHPEPEFLKDIAIDYDTNWKKAEKKIMNYLESCGLDRESLQKSRTQELFF